VLVNGEIEHKERLEDAREVWDTVRANEEALDGSGRVLVRASGTEPIVRVMVEAESEELARRHADSVAERIASALA
jgi:phosphoglucosamine mutase